MADLSAPIKPDNIEFHDGTIKRVFISIPEQLCEMELHLGDWVRGQPKVESVFSCRRASSFFGRFDFADLAFNASPGNIQDGRLSEAADRLMLYLVGGLVEAVGGEIELHARAHTKAPPKQAGKSKWRPGGFSRLRELGDTDLDWSVLVSIEFSPETNTCHLNLLAWKDGIFSERYPVRVSFRRVASCIGKLDLARMAEDSRLGNVRNCMVDIRRKTALFYLENGFIEVVARSASIDLN